MRTRIARSSSSSFAVPERRIARWLVLAVVLSHSVGLAPSGLAPRRLQSLQQTVCVTMGHGRPHTPESRAKISAANRGKEPWNKGRAHSAETRAKISATTRLGMEKRRREQAEALGITNYTEWDEARKEKKKRIVEEKKPRNTTLSLETRSKISTALKARWQDPKLRAEMTEQRLKRRNESTRVAGVYSHSVETRRKISERVRERLKNSPPVSPGNETRARISATLKARWKEPEFRARMMTANLGATARDRSADHSRKIADAIRNKWSTDPSYRERALGGIRRAAATRTNVPSNHVATRPRKERAPRAAPRAAPVEDTEAQIAAKKQRQLNRAIDANNNQAVAENAKKKKQKTSEEAEDARRNRIRQTAPDLWAALYDDDVDEDEHHFA